MQGYSLKASRLARKSVVAAGLALALLAGGTALSGSDAVAQDRDRDMMRLQDQLRDCRGDACVPIREQMMTRLRDQLRSCSGGQCEEMQQQMHLHEQVRDCHASSDSTCRQLRMEERERVRIRFQYGPGNGMGRGMGGGMGDGKGKSN